MFHLFQFDDEEGIITTVTFFVGLVILGITIFTLTLILQHLFCIPKSSAEISTSSYHHTIGQEHGLIYFTLSVAFATICVIVNFLPYLACPDLVCGSRAVGWTFTMLYSNSYILAKLLLYLIFITRLFTPYYHRIYQYGKYIQYSLWTLMFILIVSLIIFNIYICMAIAGIELSEFVEGFILTAYLVTDCILAIYTMVLFLRPLCYPRSTHTVYPNADTSIVMKYGIVSGVQLLAAVSSQIAFLIGISLEMTSASDGVLKDYTYICHIIQMVDCLLLMICIYLGFVRKKTVCILTIPRFNFVDYPFFAIIVLFC